MAGETRGSLIDFCCDARFKCLLRHNRMKRRNQSEQPSNCSIQDQNFKTVGSADDFAKSLQYASSSNPRTTARRGRCTQDVVQTAAAAKTRQTDTNPFTNK
jgi:hypothetical protein